MGVINGIMDGIIYPPPGFHFLVVIEMFPQTPQDFRFQSVSGLNVEIPTEAVAEGGENRFKHQMPGIPQYGKLVLKRGMFIGSFLSGWFKNAFENFEIDPKDVIISLLNDLHVPLTTWHVYNAYPVKVNVSDFNAEQNTLVIETLELAFQYYRMIGLDSKIPGVAGVVSGGISGAVNI